MTNDSERPAPELPPHDPSPLPAPPDDHRAEGPGVEPEANQNNQSPTGDDLIAELKRRLEESRLPADLREQILAELPPLEEQERLYRELQEKGGLSSEEFFASLGLARESQR